MDATAALTRYVQSRIDTGCADRTVETVERRLERLLRDLPDGLAVDHITKDHLETFFDTLREGGLANGTLAGYKSTILAWFNWLVGEEIVVNNPAVVLKKRRHSYSYAPVNSHAADAANFLTVLNSLDAFAGDNPRNIRDAAIISLAADSSARRGEIHNLRRIDIQRALESPVRTPAGHAVYRCASQGKTGLVHIRFYFHSAQYLTQWLAVMPADAIWLWTAVDNPKRLHVDYMRSAFQRACKFAGVPVFRFHAVRKRDVTDIIQSSGDAKIGQLYAGHKDIRTTQAYYNEIDNDHVDQLAAELASQRRTPTSPNIADDFFKPRE